MRSALPVVSKIAENDVRISYTCEGDSLAGIRL